jgi:hypothetical protein
VPPYPFYQVWASEPLGLSLNARTRKISESKLEDCRLKYQTAFHQHRHKRQSSKLDPSRTH